MTFENFLKCTLLLQKQDRILNELNKCNFDLVNFVDPYNNVISTLIKEIYGEEGYDWFAWFCFENDYGTGDLQAWDESGNAICYSHESLWIHLESLKKENGQS